MVSILAHGRMDFLTNVGQPYCLLDEFFIYVQRGSD